VNKTILSTLIALWVVTLSSSRAHAQAIFPPTRDPQSNDTACLGLSSLRHEGDIEYETFMTSAIKLSPGAKTATLPLHKGFDNRGSPVYYILTESSDCNEAKARHINYSPKLGFLVDAAGNPLSKSVQQVARDREGKIHFTGTADFSPVRVFTPSVPDGWPPAASQPGSVADADYSPFITYVNGQGRPVVFNASQVANATGVKDFIPEIDYDHMTVTFNLVMGIYDFNFVMYLRMDASDATISGFEGGIYAPNPAEAPIGGDRFFEDGSARQVILPVLNGIRGVDRRFDRQGLQSAALGEGDPFNVMGAKPGDDQYSPIWDVTPVVWTDAAIAGGRRQRLHQDDEVRAFVLSGDLVGLPGATGPINADIGIKSLGVVSNCPIMLRVMKGLLPYNSRE
jgi:hypothetical protein